MIERRTMEQNEMRNDTKWQKENVKRVVVKLYKNTDKELIEYIEKQPNVQGLIKQLIREHMAKGSE